MIQRTQLAKAIALALTVAAFSMVASTASATSTTIYNTAIRTGVLSTDPLSPVYNVPNRVRGTDGWVYGSIDNGASYNWNYPTPVGGFVGIGGADAITPTTPFGYAGKAHLNWAVELGALNDTAEISKADALSRYSAVTDVEIDTGADAWQDGQGVPTGWKHLTDIGLLKSTVGQWVTLNLTRVSAPSAPGTVNDNFGITVFSGKDTNTGAYSHHGGWNCPTCSTPTPYTNNNPFGTTGLTYLTHDATVDSLNGLTFFANAAQEYSIYVGGAGVGVWNVNTSDYKLNITTSAVPVPAAAWLFGGAMASLIGAIRRKRILAA